VSALLGANLASLSYGLEWVGVVLFLWFAIFKFPGPLVKTAMERREASIRDSLESGARAKEEGERLVAGARDRLEGARREAEQLVEQARRSAAQLEEDGRRQAEEDAVRIVARAEIESEIERARVAEEVAAQVSEVVLAATDEVVRRELDSVNHRRLVEEAIRAAEAEVVA
jgi:F-type H+-transporting ATPase subunit b